jgi:hypothetical protein
MMNSRAAVVVPVGEVVRSAGGDDLAADEQEGLVGDAQGARHVVGDDHAGDVEAVAGLLDQVVDHAAGDGVEAARRLVVDEDLRLEHERAREADALALAARQLARHAGSPFPRCPSSLSMSSTFVRWIPSRHLLAVLAQGEHDVFEDRQRVEQRRVLEDHAEPLRTRFSSTSPRGAMSVAVDPDVPGGRLLEADQHPQQGGLARARAADDNGGLVALEVHGDPPQDQGVPEALDHVVHEDVIVRQQAGRHGLRGAVRGRGHDRLFLHRPRPGC